MIRWRRLRESLYNPQANPLVFFIAAFCTGISINATSSLLISPLAKDNKTPALLIAIAFGIPALFALILITPGVLRWWIGDKEFSAAIHRARHHKGVIAIASIGPGIDTARKAIEYHLPQLEKAWLICSDGGGQSSKPLALALKVELESTINLPPDIIELVPLPVNEFEHPEAVKNAIEKIYENLPENFSEKDVIIDLTGGRKLTTAGAFLAGLPKGRHLEVINPKGTGANGQIIPDDPVEIDISFSLKKAGPR